MENERNRTLSEEKLITTVSEMIEETGFEKLGINQVAKRAGLNKNLIYRYFGTLDGLICACIEKYDFWINFPRTLPPSMELSDFLKKMFRRQIEQLHKRPILKRLYRWELSTHNVMIDQLRQQREETRLWLIDAVSQRIGRAPKEVAAVGTIVGASIDYLAMLEDFCPAYNGIPLTQNEGWEQVFNGIDLMIDGWFGKFENSETRTCLFKRLKRWILSFLARRRNS